MAVKYFVGSTDDKWSIDDSGGGIGSNWYDAPAAGNPVAKPVAGDDCIIIVDCDGDETIDLTTGDIEIYADGGPTLTIADGVTITCTDLAIGKDTIFPGNLTFVLSANLTVTGTVSEWGSYGDDGPLVSADGATGTFSVTSGMALLYVGFDILGTSGSHFTIDGVDRSHDFYCNSGGYLNVPHKFKYVDFVNLKTGFYPAECAFSLDTCKFGNDGSDENVVNLHVYTCDWRHCRIINCDFTEVTTSSNIYLERSHHIFFHNCYIENGGGTNRSIYVSGYGMTAVFIGGGIGYDRAGNQHGATQVFNVRNGSCVECYGAAIFGTTTAVLGEGARVTISGLGYFDATWKVEWDEHETYVEAFNSNAEKMSYSTDDPGVQTINLDDDDYHAPTECNPWVEMGWIRVKGGNTPSVSVDWNFSDDTGIETSVQLVLNPGGVFGGQAEVTDESNGDNGTLTATLGGALAGTDEYWLPFEIRCTGNADGVTVALSNFVPSDTGVNDVSAEFGPMSNGSWPLVLAASGGGTAWYPGE